MRKPGSTILCVVIVKRRVIDMVVEKRDGKWCTIHCHGADKGKVIACFPTKEAADAQHSAIEASKHATKLEIDTDELAKSSKHHEMVTVTRGGKQFKRNQLVGSDLKPQWNEKINKTMQDLSKQAESGMYSTTLAAGLKQMGRQAGRLLEVEKFLYDVKKRANNAKK